jgi:serine-aspartate repeat-containing protein C/D/E
LGRKLALAAAVLWLSLAPVLAVADTTDGPVTVRVTSTTGAGVAGIVVVATDPSGASVSGTTGPDGSLTIPTATLSGGKYRVEASIPASMPAVKPASSLTDFVDVSGGRAANLTMTVGGGDEPPQLGDRVWFDTDGDGIQDGDEPGLPGVRVSMSPCGGGDPIAEKTTDAAGHYLFGPADGVRAGACYTLKFDYSQVHTDTLPGSPPVGGLKWTVLLAGGPGAANSQVNPATGTVDVTAGGVNDDVDAGLVGGLDEIGDLVWADVNRNGARDPGETGIAGVPVSLRREDGTVVTTTTTGAHGQYRFSHLPDGRYQVCFDATKLPAQYADYQFTRPRAGALGEDSAADPGTGCTATTEVGPGRTQDLTLDAGLAPPVNRIAARIWADSPGRPPIAGVPVKLRTEDGIQVALTASGPDGGYLFDDIPDGSYQVCVDLAELPPPAADYTPVAPGPDSAADPATGCTRTVTVGLGNRDERTLNAGLAAPPNTIDDRVWVDTNRNGRQDAGESGAPGVPVTLFRTDGTEVATATTGDDGRYRFDQVPDGVYRVCLDRGRFPPALAGYQWTRPGAGEPMTDSDVDPGTGCSPDVTLGVDQRQVSTVDAGVVPPRNRIGDLVWLDRNGDGVLDPGEPGVSDVAVTMIDASGKPVARTRTGPDGRYLLDDLPDGSYRVCLDLTRPSLAGYRVPGSPDGCLGPVTVGPQPREDLTVRVGLVTANPAVAPLADRSSTGGFPFGWTLFAVVTLGACAGLALRWRKRFDV